MYRSYENPHALEKAMEEMRGELERMRSEGACEEELDNLWQDIGELRERVNLAWRDEYESW